MSSNAALAPSTGTGSELAIHSFALLVFGLVKKGEINALIGSGSTLDEFDLGEIARDCTRKTSHCQCASDERISSDNLIVMFGNFRQGSRGPAAHTSGF
jgi:hypothetical protein